jgi:4-amino-4-deoxy-L-arabinose transferase-like glycosyltransferase
MGRLLVLDGVLAFLVTLSVLAALEAVRAERLRWRWWLVSAAACGLGVLTKGPVAVILLVPPLWLHQKLCAGTSFRIPVSACAVFAATVLAVALPWYAAVCVHLPEFAHHFLWEHNVVRFLTPFDHQRPVWFYAPLLLAGLLPATLLLIPFVRFLWSADGEVARCRTPELGFALLAGGWCVLFFSLSGCKLPTYILPAFPFLSLAFGSFMAHSPWGASVRTKITAAAALALLLLSHYVLVPWYARYRSPMNRPEEVVSYCGDRKVPVVCYPRPIDSVAFYLGRSDFRSYRSKHTGLMLEHLREQDHAVVLFSHRHSLKHLQNVLPPGLRLTEATSLGLCDMAVVRRIDQAGAQSPALLVP